MKRQIIRLAIAFAAMFVMAQIPPRVFKAWAVPLYVVGVVMLIGVIFFGVMGKGAQRWLDLGFMRFQPSEWVADCVRSRQPTTD